MRLRVAYSDQNAGWIPCEPDQSIGALRASIANIFKLPIEFTTLELLNFPLLDAVVAGTVLQSGDLIVVRLAPLKATHAAKTQTAPVVSSSRSSRSSSSSSSDETSSEELRPVPAILADTIVANGVSRVVPRSAAVVPPRPAAQIIGKRNRQSSSSSSSSSSTSSSSSSSSSEASSSSSSSASTESTHAIETADRANRISTASKLPRVPPLRQAQFDTHTTAPGEGSAATKARNARKRKKRNADKAALRTGQPDGGPVQDRMDSIAEENGTPVPPHNAVSAILKSDYRRDSDLTMFSLTNKNKRKGYKKALTQNTAAVSGQIDSAQLPANLVISRVNVDEEGWEPGQRTLIQGEFDRIPGPQLNPVARWGTAVAATRTFVVSPRITDPATLQPGEAIAVQVLELDSTTLTPTPRLFWGTLAAVEAQTVDAPHLLPTAADSSAVPVEIQWTLRLKLHPACLRSLEPEEPEEDDELSIKRSIRLAQRQLLAAELSVAWEDLSERSFAWSELLAAAHCT